MLRLSLPRAMRIAPKLDETVRAQVPQSRHLLLVNPFYAKDPHASFGKHVLTNVPHTQTHLHSGRVFS
ncbi:MAG: hypothetical protein FJ267_05380 [Planctomycetes bacterium]|nr:hypothetical protein [Planctomycetota bacterium]